MNRIAAYIILPLYLIFSIGLRVDINYCGTQVSSVDVLVWQGDGCCCADGSVSDCCSTESLVFKTTSEQNSGPSLNLFAVDDLQVGWADFSQSTSYEILPDQEVIEDPPEIPDPPAHIRFSRLLLYG